MGIRRQARELSIQALYMAEYAERNTLSSALLFFEQFSSSPECQNISKDIITKIYHNSSIIDGHIVSSSENWSIQRMSKVDRAILRVAVCELFIIKNCPNIVVINEAIEISKFYGSEDSPMFINGVLDKILSGIMDTESERESSQLELEPVELELVRFNKS